MSIQPEIEVFQGESRDIEFEVVDDEGDPFDLTGFDVLFKAVRDETEVEISKSTGAGIVVTDAPAGKTVLSLDSDDTSDAGHYLMELRITDNGTTVTTLFGDLTIRTSLFGG